MPVGTLAVPLGGMLAEYGVLHGGGIVGVPPLSGNFIGKLVIQVCTRPAAASLGEKRSRDDPQRAAGFVAGAR